MTGSSHAHTGLRGDGKIYVSPKINSLCRAAVPPSLTSRLLGEAGWGRGENSKGYANGVGCISSFTA